MSRAWYALRRTLPPWNIDETLPELIGFCRDTNVEEVIVKVDSEEFSHGLTPVAWLDGYMPFLTRIRDELRANGIGFSINPWITVVHCDRGRDTKANMPDVDLMVGHDGTKCRACACVLSEGWRRHTAKLWTRYASLEPDVLWVEDDIRLLNHQPVEYGCFCALHIAEFNRRAGTNATREELVKALLAPGKPHAWRKIWLDMNRDVMVDVARFFEQTVHEVSPKTKLGLMCSSPESHAIEGRDWKAFANALAGNQPLVARPCMFNYDETSPRGLYTAAYLVRSTMSLLGSEVIIQTEVENWPFTTFSKSARFTFLQLALSFALGADGVTMNLFDHMGTPIAKSPEFGSMLKEKKAFLNALAERCWKSKAAGTQIIHPQDGSYHVKLEENATYQNLAAGGHAWRNVLEPLGFPITFEESGVVALSGQVVRALSDERLLEILSKGGLVDLSALRCFLEMGYGKHWGVEIKRIFHKYDEPLAAEEHFDPEFDGAERKYMTLTLPDLGGDEPIAELTLAEGARAVSRLVDPDTKPKYAGMTLFENRLGGRVAVYPMSVETCAGAAFLNMHRRDQITAVMNWLSHGRTPLIVKGGAWALPIMQDKDSYSVVGTFNLTLDEWAEAEFNLFVGDRTPKKVEILRENGRWTEAENIQRSPVRDSRVTIKLNQALQPVSFTALTVWWK